MNSTLLIFDVYRKIASASFPPAVRAVAIDEGDGESSEPDLDGTVRIKLEWSYVTEGVAPPKEFRLVVMKIVKAFFVEAIQKKKRIVKTQHVIQVVCVGDIVLLNRNSHPRLFIRLMQLFEGVFAASASSAKVRES